LLADSLPERIGHLRCARACSSGTRGRGSITKPSNRAGASAKGQNMERLESVEVPLGSAVPSDTPSTPSTEVAPRHSVLVRATHWITVLCFLALLVTGIEFLTSHPRFYWGETGNVLTKPLFQIPIPASRRLVPTGYGYVLPDQNGWSRYLHFQSAWIVALTGLLYVISAVLTGHLRK